MSARIVREVMTRKLVMLEADRSAVDAARSMRDHDVGDVLVIRGGELCGIVTDRDIVVRCIAEDEDPGSTELDALCTGEVVTVSEDATVGEAVKLMIDRSIRRLPVVSGRKPVGIVTLGDLAVEQDRESALGRISAAPPSR